MGLSRASLPASNGETGAPCTGTTFLPSSEMSGVPQWGGPFVLPTAEKTCSYCDFATAVVVEMRIEADRDGDIYTGVWAGRNEEAGELFIPIFSKVKRRAMRTHKIFREAGTAFNPF